MNIAFYKGRKRLFNRLASWWLAGPYSHCELVLGTDEIGRAICASSSMLDGGVRVKHIALNPAHWDVLPVQGNAALAWEWLAEHEGAGYDYLGMLGLIARVLGHSQDRFMCSESVGEMLGVPDAWRLDPCVLSVFALYQSTQTIASEIKYPLAPENPEHLTGAM